jgi:hypothetical protein
MPVPAAEISPADIDEFCDLHFERVAFAPKEKRYQTLLDRMKLRHKDMPPLEDLTETGLRYRISVSACSKVTTIDVLGAWKKLGAAKFRKVCTVTVRALGKFLTTPEIELLSSSARTGYRTYVPVALEAPAIEKAVLEKEAA